MSFIYDMMPRRADDAPLLLTLRSTTLRHAFIDCVCFFFFFFSIFVAAHLRYGAAFDFSHFADYATFFRDAADASRASPIDADGYCRCLAVATRGALTLTPLYATGHHHKDTPYDTFEAARHRRVECATRASPARSAAPARAPYALRQIAF